MDRWHSYALWKDWLCEVLFSYEHDSWSVRKVYFDRILTLLPKSLLGYESIKLSWLESTVTTEVLRISIVKNDMVGGPLSADSVILQWLSRVEVECEQ